MLVYVVKRLALLPVILGILSMVIFSFNLALSPYDRLAVFCSNPDVIRNIDLEELVHRYGLDKPIFEQYWAWLKALLQGDLGWSQSARMPVSAALSKYISATIELMLFAIVWTIWGSIALGTYAGTHKERPLDQTLRVVSTVSLAIPEFILGLLFLVIFYVLLGWFPPGRLSLWAQNLVASNAFVIYTNFYTIDALLNGRLDVFLDAIRHIVLPSLTVAFGMWTTLFRLMRSSLLETIGEDYVLVARAKGLKEKVVINKHARRNALLPYITQAGTTIVRGLGGAVIVESVFNFKGMGMFLVTAATTLDFPAILGVSLVIGASIVLMNLIIDVLYTVLDPRVRLR